MSDWTTQVRLDAEDKKLVEYLKGIYRVSQNDIFKMILNGTIDVPSILEKLKRVEQEG